MLKIFMMIVIVLCCYLVGYNQSLKLVGRVKLLSEIENMLIYIKNSISYMARPVGEIFYEMGSNYEFQKLDFITKTNEELQNGKTFSSAFSKAVNETQLELNDGEKEMLISFGEQVGNSDVEGELGKIEFFKEQVKTAREEAREKRDKTAKLYTSLGTFAGLALVLILL